MSVLQTKCLSSLWILCMSWSPVNRTRKFNFIHKTRKYALDKLIQTKLSEHLLDHNKMIWAKSTYTFLHLTRIELKSRRKWDSYSKNEIRLQLVVWVNDLCFWFAYVKCWICSSKASCQGDQYRAAFSLGSQAYHFQRTLW